MTDTTVASQNADLAFETLGLYPGTKMQLQAIADEPQPHHWVTYIGCIGHGSVLTTLPLEHGKGMWIQAGQTFVIRGFNGKYAYAFTSQVLRARAHPFAYLHFSWPQSIEGQIVRNSLRVDVILPVHVLRADGSSVATTLLDVSISGAMLDSSAELGTLGDKVRLELVVNLDGNAVKMNMLAAIRNIHRKDDEVGYKVGLEFIDVSQNDHLMLNYFIDSVTQSG
jgi:c-di-GMP-binding flagellar brake protein YcgR